MDDDTFIEFVLGDDPTEALWATIERLCADGLLQYDGHELRLTAAGLRVLLIHAQNHSTPTLRINGLSDQSTEVCHCRRQSK